jgi:hypothetical protein
VVLGAGAIFSYTYFSKKGKKWMVLHKKFGHTN